MPELLCPVCGGVLAQGEKVEHCPSGHSFDRAKSGYVNLLVARQSGAQHGDDKEMVRARRAFLDGGWYALLRDALCSAAVRHAPAEGTVDLLDAGCGECYYTAAVAAALRAAGKRVSAAGADISRDALRWGGTRAGSAIGGGQCIPTAGGGGELRYPAQCVCALCRRRILPGAAPGWYAASCFSG